MMWLCMIYAARRQLCMWLGCDVGGSLCASVAQGRSLMRRLFMSCLHCWFCCCRYLQACRNVSGPACGVSSLWGFLHGREDKEAASGTAGALHPATSRHIYFSFPTGGICLWAWLACGLATPPHHPQQRVAGQALATAHWLCNGAVFFRGSLFKHPYILPGVQHIWLCVITVITVLLQH